MSRPSAAELIERLRVVHAERLGVTTLSDEDLAAQLPIGLRTFHRWKAADTRGFTAIMAMLLEAGWITTAVHDEHDDPPEAHELTLDELRVELHVVKARVDALTTMVHEWIGRHPPNTGDQFLRRAERRQQRG